MSIETRNNISFKAVKLSDAKILTKTAGKWKRAEVAFIELNPRNKNDLATIKNVDKYWGGHNMSGGIFEETRHSNDPIYALTSQKKDFDEPIHSRILGLLTSSKPINKAKGSIEICKLGTIPTFAYEQNHKQRSAKHIGKTLVQEFVKLVNGNKKIDSVYVRSEPESVKFYQRIKMPTGQRPNEINVFELPRDQFEAFVK